MTIANNVQTNAKNAAPFKEFKFYMPLAMLFTTFLLVANVVAIKPMQIGSVILPICVLVFPLTFIIAVAITEVYGYERARKVIWMAMICNFLMAVFFKLVVSIPPTADFIENQEKYAFLLDSSFRVVGASLLSFCVGEFLNAYTIAKMKIISNGKRFWMRAISAMSLSEAAGTFVFTTAAFYGVIENERLFTMGLCYYAFKVIWAVCATPMLSGYVSYLKKAEGVDTFDTDVSFNPFASSKAKLSEAQA